MLMGLFMMSRVASSSITRDATSATRIMDGRQLQGNLAIPTIGKPEHVINHPNADIILCSRDSHEFKVPKIYIIDNSPILARSIRTASSPSEPDTAVHTEASLPVVRLSDGGDILSSLLSFILPMTPHLPPTTEKTMELLSAAQKYEMSLALTRIRDHVTRQDPPLIREETAFHVYSLAKEYGLRQEALQAARLTLKVPMSMEGLESKFDILSGAALYELWAYHQRVRDYLADDLTTFRIFGVVPRINFRCVRLTSSDVPTWLDDYIESVARNPALFNLSEFHMALVRHAAPCGGLDRRPRSCPTCASISSKVIDTFWTTFTSFFQRSIEGAEADFKLQLDRETQPRGHLNNSTADPFSQYLDTDDGDIIVQSSDLARFRVHKSILSMSSPFFRDMLSLPQPSDSELVDGLHVVHLSEDAEVLHSLITKLYPIPSEIPESCDKTLALLAALQKYDMTAVQSSVRAEMKSKNLLALTGTSTFRAYGIASAKGLGPEMETAARLTLDYPMTFESMGDQLSTFGGWALRDLARFRKRCRDSLVSCLESLLDSRLPPLDIWVGCYNTTDASLASWLQAHLSEHIKNLQQTFTRSLLKPSGLRAQYLAALQAHINQTSCAFCSRVHVMHGETFCVQIEKNLEKALDQVRFNLDFGQEAMHQLGTDWAL
ncbi:hypothetical protein BJV78DRAFT_1191208 [Lactifluus subvellereus]|nr:hypothetical protein BJV78DRAFT_1191208 [Lactifluus subvellereus]